MNRFFTMSITGLLLAGSSLAEAGIYKWVDEQGQVHYGERPAGEHAEKMQIQDVVTETRKVPLKSKEEQAADKEKKKKAEQKKSQQPKLSAGEKRRRCQQARHELDVINSRGRLREINSKGEYIYLPEEKRQQRIARARKEVGKYCR